MSKSCKLYRHYNEKCQLLYVGISLNVSARLAEHRACSEWFEQIRFISVENFPSRAIAADAERIAIKNENPLFNVVYGNAIREPHGLIGVFEVARILNMKPGVLRVDLMRKRFPLPPVSIKPYKWLRKAVENYAAQVIK